MTVIVFAYGLTWTIDCRGMGLLQQKTRLQRLNERAHSKVADFWSFRIVTMSDEVVMNRYLVELYYTGHIYAPCISTVLAPVS